MEVIQLIRKDQQARLHFERSDKSVNVLDEICLQQLEQHVSALEADPPEVLILESGMPGCFIAGADLEIIAAVDDADKATALAHRGQDICNRIERLSSVSVAVVNGACMGGGLEVALACDYIVAVTGKKTRLALPEIKIGIHPGFGGCVRLPKRVGWLAAVDMILTGRAVDARRARRIGLAAIQCEPEQSDAAVAYVVKRGKVGKRKLKPAWLMLWPARALFFQQVEKRAMQRFQHLEIESAYPAVPAAISLLKSIIGMGDAAALKREAESLGRMAVTPTCKNLIRVFHLGESLQKQESVKRGRASAAGVQKTAVYGAGVMGSGIAWVAARTGDVDLHEVAPEPLGRGMKGLARLAARDAGRFGRIRPVMDSSGLKDCDVVIEAVLEELQVKRALWQEVAKHVPKQTLLLSNTSSLSISDMQARRKGAERIAGLHFFNPAPKMPLVEVVAGSQTSEATLDTAAALTVLWGKYPVIVADKPGFLVNRCLMPFMASALHLIGAGQKPEHIDGALKTFGMPMGAIELADRVGLDICKHVGDHLGEKFGDRFAMPEWFGRMVKDGLLGAKSGAGFFVYDKDRQQGLNADLGHYLSIGIPREHETAADIGRDDQTMLDADIVDFCLIPMLVEALNCLHEKVVEDAEHLDAAFIFGIGFPPFRGGLLRYFATRHRPELRQKIADQGFEIPGNLKVLDDFA